MAQRSVDTTILQLGAQQRGAVTLAGLLTAGLTSGQVRSRLGGLLTRVAPGVFVVGLCTREAMTSAALLCVGGSVLSHGTAAELHDLPAGVPRVITVSSMSRTRRSLEGVSIHRTRWLPAEDRTVVGGRSATSVERTVCDLAAQSSARRLRHLLEFAISSRRTTAEEMQACILSYRRQGRRGSRLLRILGAEVFGESSVAASELERQTVALLCRYALDGWTGQFRPPWFDGVRGVVDFAWPAQRVVLEVDGRRWHTMTQAFDEDRRRDQAAIAAGWQTVRAGWQQVMHRPEELAVVLRIALEQR